MKLAELITELTDLDIDFYAIKEVITNLGVTSTEISEIQATNIKNALGVTSSTIASESESDIDVKIAESRPSNLHQASQQIHSRKHLTEQSLIELKQLCAAIEGRTAAINEQTFENTRKAAYHSTKLHQQITALQQEKEVIMSVQPNSDIDSFLGSLGFPTPTSVCSSAVALAKESLAEANRLQQEKKA